MIVGVDGDRFLPSRQSIYQGEYARFLLVLDPIEFICNENDFSTSDDDVTITMEEGADNTVRVSVAEDLSVGTEVEISFRGQLFMTVTVAGYPRTIDVMRWPNEIASSFSNDALANFELPNVGVNDYIEISVNYGNIKHATIAGSYAFGNFVRFANVDAPEGYSKYIQMQIVADVENQYIRAQLTDAMSFTEGMFITAEITKWLHDGVMIFPGTI